MKTATMREATLRLSQLMGDIAPNPAQVRTLLVAVAVLCIAGARGQAQQTSESVVAATASVSHLAWVPVAGASNIRGMGLLLEPDAPASPVRLACTAIRGCPGGRSRGALQGAAGGAVGMAVLWLAVEGIGGEPRFQILPLFLLAGAAGGAAVGWLLPVCRD